MPDSARILGARFYYYDEHVAPSIALYLTDYTGLGGTRDLLTGTSSDGGFGSVYLPMGASYDPYIVDQSMYALNAIAIGANQSTLQLCGVRVFYEAPSVQADQAAAEAPPVITATRGDVAAGMVPAIPVSTLPAKAFARDLQLPQGAVAQGVRVYYANRQLPDGVVQTWHYTGATEDLLGTMTTTGHTGSSSTYQAFPTPYTVDHFTGSLGVVPWVVYNPTYRFCGVRVFYWEGTTARYRFVAGSAFHPRTSATNYTYMGGGCIAVAASTAFVPLMVK